MCALEEALAVEWLRYHLSAVCLHSGTAHGGHYHSFIRDPSGEWKEGSECVFEPFDVMQREPLESLYVGCATDWAIRKRLQDANDSRVTILGQQQCDSLFSGERRIILLGGWGFGVESLGRASAKVIWVRLLDFVYPVVINSGNPRPPFFVQNGPQIQFHNL